MQASKGSQGRPLSKTMRTKVARGTLQKMRRKGRQTLPLEQGSSTLPLRQKPRWPSSVGNQSLAPGDKGQQPAATPLIRLDLCDKQ